MWYRAIHSEVLVVYTENEFEEVPAHTYRPRDTAPVRGDWAAYVVPVPGMNHEDEVHLWRAEGCKLNEGEARALFGGLTEEFDKRGLRYRECEAAGESK